MRTEFPFPRRDDGLGHAWGLRSATPEAVWERFSPSYEAQAEAVWRAFERMGWEPSLKWAGSEDGEAIIARDRGGELVVIYHLEDPAQAARLHDARQRNDLEGFIQRTSQTDDAEHARSAGSDGQTR